MLPSHPDLFALRFLLELFRRPRVLAFVVRSDPSHIRSWPEVAANLEHLASHRGVRFVTASTAAAPWSRNGAPTPKAAPSAAARNG
jgi:hypothetical protein